ncbi:MAG: GIY-YIG nuclease family protein [Candidatus Pacebacteria bacterium]|nr:GIY-YIG nuclease family protein [Candidatus Paceibacterota bacterium]
MFYVYILRCADSSLYTGFTTNLARRLAEHNGSKKAARYTRGRTPVSLVYHEQFRTRGRALSREAQIKKLTRTQKIELISAC